jgi:hypothetical protein
MCPFSTYDLEVHVEVRNVQENRNSCCYWRDLNTQGSELHLDDGRVYTTEATAASALSCHGRRPVLIFVLSTLQRPVLHCDMSTL